MKSETLLIENNSGAEAALPDAGLVFAFAQSEKLETISALWPKARIIGFTLEDAYTKTDRGAIACATEFNSSRVHVEFEESVSRLNARISTSFIKEDLKHMLVFSTLENINGEDLLDEINSSLPRDVSVTGAFSDSELILDSKTFDHGFVLVGFYGENLEVRNSSASGWRPFGGAKQVTGVEANQIYELDHRPALETYSAYLGEYKKHLPASSFLFPFGLQHGKHYLLRSALDIDEQRQSLTLGANVPRGSMLNMMTARHTDLVDAAQDAASRLLSDGHFEDSLFLVFSSISRRLLMGERAVDEIKALSEIYPCDRHKIVGIYTRGEASPLKENGVAFYHNQSISVTRLEETC